MLARLARVSPGALAALLWLCAADETALAANPAKIAANCRKEIVKAAAKLFQKEAAILKTCRDKAATGKLCNVKAQAKEQKSIDQARAKFSKAITKKCGGKDKTCGAFDADATQPSLTDIGWNVGTCPEFEAKGCTNAIADCDGIATCIQCIAELSVHQALDLSYPPGRPAPTDKAQKKLKTCQTTIGKEAVSFLIKRSSALSACWVKKLGKPVTVCPGDAKTQKKLAKLEVTLNAKIAKKCTAFDNSTIALPATCVAVTSEGGTPCNTNLVSAADVATCVGCVTTFNVDCVDRLGASSAGATYPAGCITAVPTPTQTPTPTLTPTPTVTPTPGTCGDNQIQPPEDCDGAATVGRKCGPAFACDGSCNCACPTRLHFAGDATDPNSILDSGWTGISHRAPIISNGDVTIGLSCSATSRDCGVCDVTGLVPNANADAGEHNNQRCSQDSSIKCTNDTPCLAGGGTCKFYFGAPLPLAAGGVTSCVINQFAAEVTGTANVETGDAATVARLNSRVFLGFTVDNPCARCVGDATINDGVAGGTCDSGPRLGLACDGNGLAPGRDDFGVTSLDCPMAGTGIAVLPINLTNATGTVTKTLSAANPKCTATGYTSERCLCSTCNNAAQEPCSVNTDCPANGGGDGICGGLRCIGGTTPGAPCLTCIGGANHAASCANVSECPGGTCQTLCGVCQGGIVPGTPCITAAPCNPKTCVGGSNNGASCSVNSECPGGTCPIPKTCLGGTNAGAPCTVASQCPGGSCLQGNCSGSCNVPGQATASNSCDSDGDATLDCVDDSSGEGTCTLGPLDSNCSAASGHPQRGCLNDGECGGGANTCQGANRRCFLTGGFAAKIGSNTLTAQGMADVPMGDVSHPTLGAVFCIGPTGLSSINNVAGLPGPGRVTIAGTAEGLP